MKLFIFNVFIQILNLNFKKPFKKFSLKITKIAISPISLIKTYHKQLSEHK